MGSNSIAGNPAKIASTFVAEQMKIGTTESIGRAIHVVQDQAAGGHEGYQQYHGRFELDHFLMDIFPSKNREKMLFPTLEIYLKIADVKNEIGENICCLFFLLDCGWWIFAI